MKENKVLGGAEHEHGLPTIIGSWSNHYKSWRKFKKNNLLIKYENRRHSDLFKFFVISIFNRNDL